MAALFAVAALAAIAAPVSGAPPAHTAAKQQTKVKLGASRYGKVLFDGKGRALYLFTKDAKGPSQCYGACASAWPPFFARGKLVAGKGVKPGLLGTTKRSDGRRQVTYAGQPLYYYVTDTHPGQITCQNVNEFGGIWYVLKRSGDPVL